MNSHTELMKRTLEILGVYLLAGLMLAAIAAV
jgi:hypothetical protein